MKNTKKTNKKPTKTVKKPTQTQNKAIKRSTKAKKPKSINYSRNDAKSQPKPTGKGKFSKQPPKSGKKKTVEAITIYYKV